MLNNLPMECDYMEERVVSCMMDSQTINQWRSYTWAHMGQGPGKFLSALVNYAMSTYLNRNSIAVYGIVI